MKIIFKLLYLDTTEVLLFITRIVAHMTRIKQIISTSQMSIKLFTSILN